jgi:hypothetical protein
VIATISFQVDVANVAECEVLRRAMVEIAALRRGGEPGRSVGARDSRPATSPRRNGGPADPAPPGVTVAGEVPGCDPLPDPLPDAPSTTGWSAAAQSAKAGRVRPRRDEPIECPDCGRVCGSPQGLGAHRRFCTGPSADELAATRSYTPPPVEGPHALTTAAKRRAGWIAWCRCGFQTAPEPSRGDAEGALAEHVEDEGE